jgi:predicted DCC family thiol-disulfide oxidoreductase YuxK
MTKVIPSSNSALTVFYDGSCPLCSAEVDIYKNADSNNLLNLIDVSTHTFSGDAQITQQAAMKRFHVRLADGLQVSGAHAFIEIWRIIPSWRWLSYISKLPGAVLILELLYRTFLHARPLMVYLFKGIQGPASNPQETYKPASKKLSE